MECSKPAAMKAKRHHQIRMHLAASLVARALVHSARQTSQLRKAPRATRASGAAFIFAAEALNTRSAPSLRICPPPPSQKIAGRAAEPARLPSQERIQVRARADEPADPRATPIVMNIVCPVKRSEPAKTTNVSAMPKQAPMTRLRKAGSICCP